jgi:hypothetical protein
MDVLATSDVPAGLDISIVYLSLSVPLLIGISPPDMRARRISSAGAHLVKIFCPEGVDTGRESSGGKPSSFSFAS